jgi:hypothetical protein
MINQPINDGGSAFPSPPSQHSNGFYSTGEGMTLRQYAAIKLCVPDSGTDWLDDMIRKSNRDYFAAAATEKDIQEFIPATCGEADQFRQKHGFLPSRQWARYCHADVMLKARGEK